MSSWSFTTPPTWAPTAIATDRGWVDRKTGEVLVACSKLEKAAKYSSLFHKGGKPKFKGRGGARPGAGRPPKKVEEPTPVEPVPPVVDGPVKEPEAEQPPVEPETPAVFEPVAPEEAPAETTEQAPAEEAPAPAKPARKNKRAKKKEVGGGDE